MGLGYGVMAGSQSTQQAAKAPSRQSKHPAGSPSAQQATPDQLATQHPHCRATPTTLGTIKHNPAKAHLSTLYTAAPGARLDGMGCCPA